MSRTFLLTILFAHILLIPWALIFNLPDVLGRYGSFALAVILFVGMSNKSYYLPFAKNKTINVLILCLFLCTVITSFKVNDFDVYKCAKITYASHYESNGTIFGLTTSFKILVSFLFIQYLKAKRDVKSFFVCLYYIVFFYAIVSDFSMLLLGIQESGTGYLLGNKFTVSYFHLFLAVLYQVQRKCKINSTSYYRAFLLWALLISVLVHCSTAVIGVLFLFICDIKGFIMHKIIYNPMFFLSLIVVSVLFAFFYQIVLDIPFVQYIIVDLLGEDLTLTGRIYIYDAVLNVIEINPLWGYGIGNSYQLLHFLYDYPNAQNGFINLFLEQGIIGSVIVIFFFFLIVMNQVKNRIKEITFSMICLLYAMVLMAFVEITIDLWYLLLLSLLQITDKDIQQAKVNYNN